MGHIVGQGLVIIAVKFRIERIITLQPAPYFACIRQMHLVMDDSALIIHHSNFTEIFI